MPEPHVDPARTIPILPSPDIKVTRAFYRDSLGFSIIGPEMDSHLIIRRGEMEIHFWKSDDLALPEVSSSISAAARCPHYMLSFRRAA